MKRTDPKLKAVALWGALFFGAIFWALAVLIVFELVEIIAQAF